MLSNYLPRIEFDSYDDFAANFKLNVPESFNFGFDIVDGWAEKEPGKPALVWCDDHGGEKFFSFTDISLLSNRAANMFKAQGIKKGDKVMLILRRRWEYWVAAVALCKLGAVIIPANLQLTTKDITYRCNFAGISAIVCVDDTFVVSQVEGAGPSIPSVKTKFLVAAKETRDGFIDFTSELEKYSDSFPRPTGADMPANDDLMLIYFTSGTTGMPKMAGHTFTHPLGHIITAKYWQQVQEGKLHLSIADSGWAKFGWGKIYGQWICGAVIFAYDFDKFIAKNILEKLEKYRITTFCAPPTMYRFMLQEDISKYDLSSIEHLGNAGEPLNPEIYRKMYDVLGIHMTEGLGQSETAVMLANFPWFEPKPGSTGKPNPMYKIDLIDSEGNSVEDGEEGRLVIRDIDKNHPVGLLIGYINDPENTKAAMGNGYYDTGDVAWRDNDGYYWFVGRNDDVIKCSGYRIGPFEVESALQEHDAVLECAVTAAPDPIRGQVVKATVVLTPQYKDKAGEDLIKELQAHVRKVTAPYKYPRIIEFVDELPKTISGKIKRAEIRSADM